MMACSGKLFPVARIIPVTDPACVDEAVRLLAGGQLVCIPTDTVYGIAAVAVNDAAVRTLYAVRARPPDKPLPLLIADAAAASWIADVTPVAHTLMSRFWPGPLTIVMRKALGFRSLALAGQQTVGLRVPDHALVRRIILALDEPITGTSANRAGARPPVSAAEAAFQMGDMVALVIDGGPPAVGRESTVVDITDGSPRVVREGAVSREELSRALGKAVA